MPSTFQKAAARAFSDVAGEARSARGLSKMPSPEGARLGRALASQTAAHPGLAGIHPLDNGPEAFAARVALTRAAERNIDAQYYIWHGDLTGTLLFEELRAAAGRGVRVRLLLDDNTTSGLDETLAALDAHPRIEVRLFNPFKIRSPRWIGYLTSFARLNRRMHNKSLIVDNQAAIVGGRNIGDEYFGAGDGGLFIDLDALVIGAVVNNVSSDFDRYWASASSYPAGRILPPLPAARQAQLAAHARRVQETPAAQRYLEAVEGLPIAKQLADATLPLYWAPVSLVSDDPRKGLGAAAAGDLLISRLERVVEPPQQRLDLVSSYFVPTKTGVEAFAAMTRRGVGVTILTNAFEATDVPVVHAGYAHRRVALLKAGIKLWELRSEAAGGSQRQPRSPGRAGSAGSSKTALHAKTFVSDGQRVFVGSFNFDPRSARLNTEMGFVIASPELARVMETALQNARPATAYEVRLSEAGKLLWIERGPGGEERRHDREPGTTLRQRVLIAFLATLPIEWLL